jgi:hypothetical protein
MRPPSPIFGYVTDLEFYDDAVLPMMFRFVGAFDGYKR